MPERVVQQRPPVPTNGAAAPAPAVEVDAWGLADWVRLLIFGYAGTGKTTLWATFPGPITCLLCSGAVQTGELRSVNTPEYRKKIRPKIIATSEQFATEVERAGDDNSQTVVLDHAGGLADLCLQETMGLERLPAQKPVLLEPSENKRIWGSVSGQTKELLRLLLNRRKHVVVVAHEKTFVPETSARNPFPVDPWVGAALNQGASEWLHKNIDNAVRAYHKPHVERTVGVVAGQQVVEERTTDQVDFCVQTGPGGPYRVKLRIPGPVRAKLPGGRPPFDIVDPTYDKLAALLQGR